jgi:DNA-binding transcriptional regulator YdaS (Cro superfamily)
MTPLEEAIDLCGGQAGLAARMTTVRQQSGRPAVRQQNVWNWLTRSGGTVPGEQCPDLEYATDGKVSCEQLRPDIDWVRVPDSAWPHPNGRPCMDVASSKAAAAASLSEG